MKTKLLSYILTLIVCCTALDSCKKIYKTGPQEDTVELTEKQRIEIRDCVNRHNRKSPFVLGTIGSVKHIALKGQHMRMFVELNSHFYKVDHIKDHAGVFKASLLDNLATMDDSYDELFAILALNDVGLRVELSNENENDALEIYISPQEIFKLSQTKQNSLPSSQVLKSYVKAHNISLPISNHRQASLISAEVDNSYLTYTFEVDETEGNEMQRIRSGKMVIGSRILKALHKSDDPNVRNIIMLCRKAHRRLAYKFVGKDSDIKVTIYFYLTPTKDASPQALLPAESDTIMTRFNPVEDEYLL